MFDISLIENSEEIKKRFGYWPQFGDDELIEINLSRDIDRKNNILTFSINAISYGTKNCVIEFTCTPFGDLVVDSFNHQNVIWELKFKNKGSDIEVVLIPSFGAHMGFICKKVSVKIK